MARKVLRDMKNATGEEIRQEMETYLKYARIAYVQMLKDILPSSDYVIDGTKELSEKVDEIKRLFYRYSINLPERFIVRGSDEIEN